MRELWGLLQSALSLHAECFPDLLLSCHSQPDSLKVLECPGVVETWYTALHWWTGKKMWWPSPSSLVPFWPAQQCDCEAKPSVIVWIPYGAIVLAVGSCSAQQCSHRPTGSKYSRKTWWVVSVAVHLFQLHPIYMKRASLRLSTEYFYVELLPIHLLLHFWRSNTCSGRGWLWEIILNARRCTKPTRG